MQAHIWDELICSQIADGVLCWVAPSCLTLGPCGLSPPGSSVHGVLQARTLRCPPPGALPDPGLELASLPSPAFCGRFFTTSATWEAHSMTDLFFSDAEKVFILGQTSSDRESLSLRSRRGIIQWLAQGLRICLLMQETEEMRVRFPGWEDPMEEKMATRSSILAWKIPWTEEPGGLQSMGLQRLGHDWAHTRALTYAWIHRMYLSSPHSLDSILPVDYLGKYNWVWSSLAIHIMKHLFPLVERHSLMLQKPKGRCVA